MIPGWYGCEKTESRSTITVSSMSSRVVVHNIFYLKQCYRRRPFFFASFSSHRHPFSFSFSPSGFLRFSYYLRFGSFSGGDDLRFAHPGYVAIVIPTESLGDSATAKINKSISRFGVLPCGCTHAGTKETNVKDYETNLDLHISILVLR